MERETAQVPAPTPQEMHRLRNRWYAIMLAVETFRHLQTAGEPADEAMLKQLLCELSAVDGDVRRLMDRVGGGSNA